MARLPSTPIPLPITREAAARFGLTGPIDLAEPRAARRLAAKLRAGGLEASAGELFAFGVLHEILVRVVELYGREADPGAADRALRAVEGTLGRDAVESLLAACRAALVRAPTAGPATLETAAFVWLANANPALEPLQALIDDRPIAERAAAYERLPSALAAHYATRPPFGPDAQPLPAMLRSPALAVPDSLAGQLEYVRERWAALLERLGLADLLDRLLLGLDLLDEEAVDLWRRTHPGGAGDGRGPGAGAIGSALGGLAGEPERFSADSAWMPRVVLLAKSTYVWLDQLAERYGREVRRLDQVPDEALDELAGWGVTGLWLIGLWQRSRASERIKRMRGNPEAVASAYSLDDYRIADDLGGESAYQDLRDRAWRRGVRLASDMVPNHMGIDSRWVVEQPERFLSLPEPPYPGYTFGGEDLSDDPRVEIRIEDHYWTATDAAVVFERRDAASGERRYVYHGNDGTSFPWNDTAQLDYLDPATREAVIQAILSVARRFPIIRFDAAMTLARRHIRRLWFPEPGAGGSIPSRAEHSVPAAAFDAAMPTEFWRDVVDRVAAEVPDTLLLAEAFWLMEGYFVRTLGMHRVYNSAFMHMLRDEDNAGYRRVMRDTLEFDPEILKRYVNFMSNPDEATAIEQFGSGDKYFGVATVLATLPGLPMLGHGQVEGYAEKYGMEYRRAYLDERPDIGLVEHHARTLFPLFHRRAQFADVGAFLLYDVVADDGSVLGDVLAYSNVGPDGERSLVVYHNRFGDASGTILRSVPYSVADAGAPGGRRLVTRTLAEGWGLRGGDGSLVAWRDHATGLEHIAGVDEIRRHGLRVELGAYGRQVLLDVRDVGAGTAGVWRRLAARLGGRGVPSLDDALVELALEPVHEPLRRLVGGPLGPIIRDGRPTDRRALEAALGAFADAVGGATATGPARGPRSAYLGRVLARLDAVAGLAAEAPRSTPPPDPDPIAPVRAALGDPWHRAVLAVWAVLEPLGGLAPGAMVGPTSRAWFDELRLGGPVSGSLPDTGLDAGAAGAAVERARTLLTLPRPSNVGGRSAPDRVRRLAEAWLRDADLRAFLGVNAWQDAEWIVRERWRELLDWALLLDALGPDDPLHPAARRSASSSAGSAAVVVRLADAAEAAGYRVDDLRARIAAPARPKPHAARRPQSAAAPTRAPRRPRPPGAEPG